MKSYPVTDPSKLEMMLFDAGLMQEVSPAVIYDIKGRTSVQQIWEFEELDRPRPDVHDPEQWDCGNAEAWIRWEFFSYNLRDCKTVLDVGCGEGRAACYIARTVPEVTAVDISSVQIELARRRAERLGVSNCRFDVADIRSLPFPDECFDGVCFSGNVLTYGSYQPQALSEICRVLKPGRVFALEQWPLDPTRHPTRVKVAWFIDGGPPIVHCNASTGLYSRSLFVHLKPDSPEGGRLADAATRMNGLLSDDQRQVCEEILSEIEAGESECVEKVLYGGEDRSIAADELPAMLHAAGFDGFESWALRNPSAFAKSLRHDGVLSRLQQEDLAPFLRALVASSPTSTKWDHDKVTCRKIVRGELQEAVR